MSVEDYLKYQQKFVKKHINYMSDSKWLKLFSFLNESLTQFPDVGYVLFSGTMQKFTPEDRDYYRVADRLPSMDNIQLTESGYTIRDDVISGGPLFFKDIWEMAIPIARKDISPGPKLYPHKKEIHESHFNNLEEFLAKLDKIGKFQYKITDYIEYTFENTKIYRKYLVFLGYEQDEHSLFIE